MPLTRDAGSVTTFSRREQAGIRGPGLWGPPRVGGDAAADCRGLGNAVVTEAALRHRSRKRPACGMTRQAGPPVATIYGPKAAGQTAFLNRGRAVAVSRSSLSSFGSLSHGEHVRRGPGADRHLLLRPPGEGRDEGAGVLLAASCRGVSLPDAPSPAARRLGAAEAAPCPGRLTAGRGQVLAPVARAVLVHPRRRRKS
jgi:hypothetical protein